LRRKKVNFEAVEFTEYATFWQDQLNINGRKKGIRLIHTWEALKEGMQRRFAPTHYFMELPQN
jgi:hypothetical protein